MIIRAKAPLRLGLAGGGTDIASYSDKYGGAVLNVTINKYAYCTIEPIDNGMVEFVATDLNQSFTFSSNDKKVEAVGDLLLHKGVYNRIVNDYCQERNLSFRMTTYCEAPAGSGLGSSSTMVVAMIKAYMEWLNLPLGEYDMALLAYEIERKDLGLSGGKQDQYAATFGGFNFIEFEVGGHVTVNPLRIKNWIRNEIESSLLLYYTGTSRDSAKIIDEQVENSNKKSSKSLESMHALRDAAYAMKSCMLKGEFERLADCLKSSWEMKKKTATVISNSEIDDIYEFIMQNGGKAAKISGAGGGGFMMILCDPTKRLQLMRSLEKEHFGQVFTVNFTDTCTQAWTIY